MPELSIEEPDQDKLVLIGDGSIMSDEIADMVGRIPLFSELDRQDIRDLATYLLLYKAKKGAVILREGEPGDYMLLVIHGTVDIYKSDRVQKQKRINTVTPGMTIGEMAMVDGEPRFATCVATEPATLAALSREGLVRIIDEKPRLGAKILVQLLAMMNQRLRHTSGILVDYLKVS
ncbi:MAG: cyclic nucleotide-binding domain-containing protein [Betaproteobacteria bacterium]|nr:cyclic nucleotide-binding domain-containing protein [Betaproteobacteria bacterium]